MCEEEVAQLGRDARAGFRWARLGCRCGVPSVNGGVLTKAPEARRWGGAHREVRGGGSE